MKWRESEFALWVPLLYQKVEDVFFMQGLMLTSTLFDPKGTAERRKKEDFLTSEPQDVAAIIADAESIMRMPGSRSLQDRSQHDPGEEG